MRNFPQGASEEETHQILKLHQPLTMVLKLLWPDFQVHHADNSQIISAVDFQRVL